MQCLPLVYRMQYSSCDVWWFIVTKRDPQLSHTIPGQHVGINNLEALCTGMNRGLEICSTVPVMSGGSLLQKEIHSYHTQFQDSMSESTTLKHCALE